MAGNDDKAKPQEIDEAALDQATGGVAQVGLGIASPRDPASGQASGRRQYSPTTFKKDVDV